MTHCSRATSINAGQTGGLQTARINAYGAYVCFGCTAGRDGGGVYARTGPTDGADSTISFLGCTVANNSGACRVAVCSI